METNFKLYNMKGVDIMTKIEKLELEKKIWKYVPMVTTVILLLIGEIPINMAKIESGTIGKTVLVIAIMIIAIINYFILRYSCKDAIKICDYKLEDERLKSEIKKQFHLSSKEYVEIFWNDEADKDKFSFSIERNYRNYGGRFFAKLISDDEIEFIVRGPDGELMEEPKRTTWFIYLREHYKTEP